MTLTKITGEGVGAVDNLTVGDSHTIGDDANDNLQIKSSSGENIKYDSVGGTHLFLSNGSEKVRFQSGGGISFNGDTASANSLDDYEETSFSPTLEGQTTAGSSPTGTGRATKIGRAVIFNILFANVTVSGAAGLLVVRGMPFVPDSNVNNAFTVASYKLEAEASFSVATLTGGSTNVEILHIADEGVWDNANIINTSNIYLYISGVYTT